MRDLPHPLRLLILGGTSEASRLVARLDGRRAVQPILSLAGRTTAPALPPIAVRVGGFGGVAGLIDFLRAETIDAVVDATHPFAARISANATAACATLALPLAVYTRAPWVRQADDQWTSVADMPAAAAALGPDPRRVFLTTGRLDLAAFIAAPQHSYLGRTIDPPLPEDCPPSYRAILGRGPFTVESEAALMRREAIEIVVTKNSGADASAAKIGAARLLGLPVVMVERPTVPAGTVFTSLAEIEGWIADHGAAP